MLAATADSHNETSGNGQFGSLTRKRRGNKRNTNGFSIENYGYLDRRDKRMRFNNAKDPIYYVFDCIENRPVSTLAKEFVRDSFKDIINFVSTVVA
ncbi:MAG: hypothetical protein KIC80_08760 [Brachyspira sp.]|jgi:hypothetical protein|nr:hypothetical protein [Brachyspira sp.]